MEKNQQEMTDAELVTVIRGGDRRAYGALIHRYTGRVFGVCLGILGEPAEAEDMTQETFLRGLEQIHKLRSPSDFAQWVAQIARNLCLDNVRVRKRRREILDENPVVSNGGNDEFDDLYAALGRLQQKDRLTLVRYYFEGHNIHGVAEELGVTDGAAYTRLSRARRALREILEETVVK
jgi:RNA polymerase sigma-70 factor, ECF subfamily